MEKLAAVIIIVQQLHKYFQENLPFYNVPQSKNHTTKLIDVFLRMTHNSLQRIWLGEHQFQRL